MGLILGLVFAFTIPLIFLVIIHRFDFYQTGQYRLILLSLGWGGLVYFLAVLSNTFIVDAGYADWDTVIRFIAPVSEEILKALFLLYLVRRPQFTYSVDGAVYGFASGIGFAVIENYEYVTSTPEIALAVAFQRVFSTNLIHASSSAIIGITLGVFRLETSRSRWLILTSGFALAIGQHMLFNNMVSRGTYLVVAVGAGILGAAYIYYAMRRGIQTARGWIKEKLGMDDRVTSGEALRVDQLESADAILLPIADRFGSEKASLVEELLFLQARLGIKRKTLDSFQDDAKMRQAVITEMNAMRTQMEEIRHAIGTYVMLFVRGTYTDDVISVWDQVQDRIQERSAATGGQKGGGLWSELDNRLDQSLNPEGIEE
jgi:RsiW-degrading membrane proteinase PrsW (M82 family)